MAIKTQHAAFSLAQSFIQRLSTLEEFHTYTMFNKRIWFFQDITFIPKTSKLCSPPCEMLYI